MNYERWMGLMWGIPAGLCFGLGAMQPKVFIIGFLPLLGAWMLAPRDPS